VAALQQVITALNGEVPEFTPLTAYSGLAEKMCSPKKLKEFNDRGFVMVQHTFDSVEYIEHGVEFQKVEKIIGNDKYLCFRKVTPVGTIEQVSKNGWHHESFIKSSDDYKILKWIANNTEVIYKQDKYEEHLKNAGENNFILPAGVIIKNDINDIDLWEVIRTPFMRLNVDYAGVQQFCLDLAMETPELFELNNCWTNLFNKTIKAFAKSEIPYIKMFENLTISMMGPKVYEEYLAPHYETCAKLFKPKNQKFCVHFDGQLQAAKNVIAKGSFSIIESLTEPPEGDMTYDKCREAWPDKVFWANISAESSKKDGAELKDEICSMIERGGKKGFLLEFAEHIPENGDEKINVILEALGL